MESKSSIFTLQYQLGQYEYAAFQWKVRVLYSYDVTLEDLKNCMKLIKEYVSRFHHRAHL